ncbi:DMT family transporter [Leuconostoc carnosum]|uniref:DMT family transporter n=1 Tax=Leuconostoc carnosum TaxID=1252 RepID=UPI00345D8B1B
MKKAYIYVFISTFLFSSMEIALKLAGSEFNGTQINFLRFGIGGLVLLPLAIHRMQQRHIRIIGRDLRMFLLTGLVGVVISMSLYQIAVEIDKASTVAVLFSSNPIFALLFSYVILHETLSRTNLLAVIISMIGLVIIVNPIHLTNPLGIALSLGSALTFGLYAIITRRYSMQRGYDGLAMTCFSFIAGALELLVIIGISHIHVVAQVMSGSVALRNFSNVPIIQGINAGDIWMLLYIAVGITAAGYVLYALAMEAGDVSTASLIFFIKPALAPILALIILQEQILLNTIIGVVVIVTGSTVMFIGNRFADKQNTRPYQTAKE